MDVNNRLNRVFYSFDLFSNEFSPGDKLIDIFTSCISFYSINIRNEGSRKIHIQKLDEIIFKVAVVVLDTSIKNQVTIFIAHIHTYDNLVIKTIHYAINITLTEA